MRQPRLNPDPVLSVYDAALRGPPAVINQPDRYAEIVDEADPKLTAEHVISEQVADAQQPDRFTDHRRREWNGIVVVEFKDPSSGTPHRRVFARPDALQTDDGIEAFLTAPRVHPVTFKGGGRSPITLGAINP